MANTNHMLELESRLPRELTLLVILQTNMLTQLYGCAIREAGRRGEDLTVAAERIRAAMVRIAKNLSSGGLGLDEEAHVLRDLMRSLDIAFDMVHLDILRDHLGDDD